MNTTVLLIRHGETVWNQLGKFQGCQDISLSREGVEQAILLKNRLKGDFEYIYTSPLVRACETAKILAQDTDKQIQIEQELREINFGDWEGLTITEIKDSYPEIFNKWRTDPKEAPISGGELSLRNASLRSSRCIKSLVEKHKGHKIAIVAHGGIIKAGILGIMGFDMNTYHKFMLGNTAVSEIVFDNDLNPMIVYLNSTSHLNQESVITYV